MFLCDKKSHCLKEHKLREACPSRRSHSLLLAKLLSSVDVFLLLPVSFSGLGSNYGLGRGLNLNIYSSNSRGRSAGQLTLETTPSKVAELQIGKRGGRSFSMLVLVPPNCSVKGLELWHT